MDIWKFWILSFKTHPLRGLGVLRKALMSHIGVCLGPLTQQGARWYRWWWGNRQRSNAALLPQECAANVLNGRAQECKWHACEAQLRHLVPSYSTPLNDTSAMPGSSDGKDECSLHPPSGRSTDMWCSRGSRTSASGLLMSTHCRVH